MGAMWGRSQRSSLRVVEILRSAISLEASLLAAVVFLAAPALIATTEEPYPLHVHLGGWIGLLGLAGGLWLLLTTLQALLTVVGLESSFRMLIQLLCYFVVLTCFAFPLVLTTALTETEVAQLNRQNLSISLALSVALLLASRVKPEHVRVGIIAYLIGNTLLIGYRFSEDQSLDLREAVAVSSTHNVFVVSFDGLSGAAMKEVLTREADLATELRGFTVFDRAASSSPATSASIAAELSGNRDFKRVAETNHELWQFQEERLITNLLLDHGFQVTTYGKYGTSLNAQGRHLRSSTLPGSSAFEAFNHGLARTISPGLAPRGSASELFRRILGASFRFDTTELASRIEDSGSPSWDKNLAYSVTDFEAFTGSLKIGTADPSAFFLHFTHTHYPVEWTRSCDFLGHDPQWFSQHQNYLGVIEESTCALRQFGQFLDALEALGVLDRSLVVFKSDHGKPVPYAEEGTIESVTINGHALWGLSRYAPFLAVRRPGANGDLHFDSSAVMLDDLARTICQEAEIDYDCTSYPGYNILTESHMIDPTEQVTAFVVQSAASDHRFDEHQAVTFPRGDNVLLSMYEALVAKGMAEEVPTKVLSFP